MALILVIDDDRLMRSTIKRILTSANHTVLEACDGHEGLKVFHAQHPDIVITDILMPEKEGIETIRELRRVTPTTKIIAISGSYGISNIDFTRDFLGIAKKFGADLVMQKPLRAVELLTAVSSLLSGNVDKIRAQAAAARG